MKLNDTGREHSCRRGPGGGPGRRSAAVPVLIRSARHCPELLTSAASGSLTLPWALVFFFFLAPSNQILIKGPSCSPRGVRRAVAMRGRQSTSHSSCHPQGPLTPKSLPAASENHSLSLRRIYSLRGIKS